PSWRRRARAPICPWLICRRAAASSRSPDQRGRFWRPSSRGLGGRARPRPKEKHPPCRPGGEGMTWNPSPWEHVGPEKGHKPQPITHKEEQTMSRTLNKVQLIGHLGKDAEMRYTQSGAAVTNFTLATNRSVRQADGSFAEETEWHAIVTWEKLAETANQ